MVTSSELVTTMAARLPAMLADLRQLVCCESPSNDSAALAASTAVVAALGARHLGAAAEELVVDGRTHLRWRLGGSGAAALLLGHHDTVWPVGSIETRPWQITDTPDGPVARGPGCFDMKAGLVQMFHALAVLEDRRGVTVLVTCDEEIGSPTSRALIEREARAARAALVLEASANGALKIARKGASIYDVSITGKAAHAGLNPETGVNAAIELATQLLRVAGFADASVGTTVTPTLLSAGSTGNTVPATGTFAVDVRAETMSELERVQEMMTAMRPQLDGAIVTVRGAINRPPLEAESSRALFALCCRIAAELGLGRLAGARVGGASDGNFTAAVGTPTIDGLGAVGGGAHADDEHVLVDHMPRRAALLAALISELE